MARSFPGTTGNNFKNANQITGATLTPLTMACWYQTTDNTKATDLVVLINAAATGWMRLASGSTIGADCNDAIGGFFGSGSAGNPSNNTWYHVAGVFTGSGNTITNITCYFNGGTLGGGGQSSGSGSAVPALPLPTCLGELAGHTPPEPLTGRMADAAIWDSVLSAGEIAALAQGFRPGSIEPKTLIGWWPLDGLQSPEPDLSSSDRNMTLNGTLPLIAGPPITPFTLRWHRFLGWTPMLSASGLGWMINRRNKLMVPKKRA